MPDDIILTGLTETQYMLIELPGEVTRVGMEKALIAGSSVVQSVLLDNTPRRERQAGAEYEFPPLEESIVTNVEVSRLEGVASTGFGEAGIVALWDEYGHRIVTHEKTDTGRTSRAFGFMRRTTDECAEGAIDAVCDSLIGTIKEQYGIA